MVVKVAKIHNLSFPLDLYYSHHSRGHMWVKRQSDGNIIIGLDHLAAIPMIMVYGAHPLPFIVELPPIGTGLKQDEPFGMIETTKYTGPFYAPMSGVIVTLNEERCSQPPHIIKNPYVDGWVLVLKPLNFEENLKNLLTGEEAIEWIRKDIIEYSTDDKLLEEAKKGAVMVELQSLDDIVEKQF